MFLFSVAFIKEEGYRLLNLLDPTNAELTQTNLPLLFKQAKTTRKTALVKRPF